MEHDAVDLTCGQDITSIKVKQEPISEQISSYDASPKVLVKQEGREGSAVRTRVVLEGGKEVFVLSDSESDSEEPIQTTMQSSDTVVPDETEMDVGLSDWDTDVNGFSSDIEMSDSEADPTPPSPTVWLDSQITSTILRGPHKLHRQLTVDSIEYLSDLPSYFPIPRDKRAFLVDLSDPKFNLYDNDGKLLSVDALIKSSVSTFLILDILLKRLSRNGTLVALGVDLELAQALGAGDHWASTNEPEFSGIPATVKVEELLEYFIKACIGHAKRYVKC